MDEIKLHKWKTDFETQVSKARVEYDAFFLSRSLEDCYQLKLNETSQQLSLTVGNFVPEEIKQRLTQIFYESRPEDSV